MEMRRNKHLHFISAIKCGNVVKVLNVTQGRPSLSFKDINRILEEKEPSLDSEVQTFPLADRSLHKMLGVNKVKSQEEIVNACCTVSDVESYSRSNKRSHDSDDNFLGEMTLGQMKKRLKSAKKSAAVSYKEAKQEYGDLHHEEDDLDLEETLGSLKCKISRGSKSRKMQKCVSACEFTVAVKSEPIPFDDCSLQMVGGIGMCASIDVEVCIKEKDFIMERSKVCNADPVSSERIHHTTATSILAETAAPEEMMKVDSFFNAEEQQVSTTSQNTYECAEHADDSCLRPETSEHEVAITDDESSMATPLPLEIPDCKEIVKVGDHTNEEVDSSSIAEEQQVCLTSSNENVELTDDSCLQPETSEHEVAITDHESSMATPLPLEIPDHKEMMEVGDLKNEVVPDDLPDPDEVCSSKGDSSPTAEYCEVCITNQINYEHLEYNEGPSAPTQTSDYEEATAADNPITAPDQPMITLLPAQVEEEAITDMSTCKESPDAVFPLHHQSVATSLQMQSEGRSCHVEPCPRMESAEEHILPDSECISVNSRDKDLNATSRCVGTLNHDDELVPDNYSKPVTEETYSSMDSGYPCDDTDKVSGSFATESTECCELQHPPERLLSTRKTISPTSQQDLCMAMNSLGLPDGLESQESKQSFDPDKKEAKESVDVGGRTVLPDCNNRPEHAVDTSPKSEQKRKKGKDDKKCPRIKGDNKPANALTPHRLTSSCTFTQSCSENVIAFSQQQMNDIERLAAKLTSELRSMKEMVIETLQPDARRSASSRYNLNEVRIAVENANKTEETTKRFLSIMARDCNRFCKLMSLTERDGDACSASRCTKEGAEKDATAVVNGNRKIRFADEDGAKLCDVRLIQDQLDSPTEHEEL